MSTASGSPPACRPGDLPSGPAALAAALAARPALDRALAALILGLWAWVAFAVWRGAWAPDLSALWFAGRAVFEGHPELVYARPEIPFVTAPPTGWREMIAAVNPPNRHIYAYVYPPLWAWLLAPVAGALDPQRFFDLARALEVIALAAAALAATEWLRPAGMPRALMAALVAVLLGSSTVTVLALYHAQPQILVSALVVASLLAWCRGRSAAAGALLAVAAAIKVGPALLALAFVARRDWQALGAFALVGAALAAASLALAGWPAHATFLERLREISDLVVLSRVNLALEAALAEAAHLAGLIDLPWTGPARPAIMAEPLAITLAVRGLMLAGLVLAWRRLAAARDTGELVAAWLLLFLTVKLTGPLAWHHHFLPLLLLLPALRGTLAPRAYAAALALLALPLAMPVVSAQIASGAHLHLSVLTGAGALLGIALILARAPARRPKLGLARGGASSITAAI